jgi:hypothetical protein
MEEHVFLTIMTSIVSIATKSIECDKINGQSIAALRNILSAIKDSPRVESGAASAESRPASSFLASLNVSIFIREAHLYF